MATCLYGNSAAGSSGQNKNGIVNVASTRSTRWGSPTRISCVGCNRGLLGPTTTHRRHHWDGGAMWLTSAFSKHQAWKSGLQVGSDRSLCHGHPRPHLRHTGLVRAVQASIYLYISTALKADCFVGYDREYRKSLKDDVLVHSFAVRYYTAASKARGIHRVKAH